MDRRLELHTLLKEALATENVYFQPPETIKLKYPCGIYALAGWKRLKANNERYLDWQRYTLTYITKDPDDPIVERILDSIEYVRFSRHYSSSDNLHHFVYEINY